MSSQTKRDPYELVCYDAYDKQIVRYLTILLSLLTTYVNQYQNSNVMGDSDSIFLKKQSKGEGARAWTTDGTCLEL